MGIFYSPLGEADMTQMTCPCPSCPQKGETWKCVDCSFTIEVKESCDCKDHGCVSLACCGKAMVKQ